MKEKVSTTYIKTKSLRLSGFTLIELLVVVAIIGILATVVIASLSQARERARIARTQSDLTQMRIVIVSAQIFTNQTVLEMTGAANPGTFNNCPGGTDLSTLSTSHVCVVSWRNAIDAIVTEDGGSGNADGFYTDPWGSPYLLDENEDEQPSNPCRFDQVFSAGPDRILSTTADNVVINLPFESCS
jgi:prepilin-type N-terminal cleavage/methylation domain-containing protein